MTKESQRAEQRKMDRDDLKEQIRLLFEPEPGEDSEPRERPHPRLEESYQLDFAYMRELSWEGSTMHPHTRMSGADEEELHVLTRNSDMPKGLMLSALRLLGESIVAYLDAKKRIRYYPAIVLTFWSGFESFVRHSSELLLLTVPEIPASVRNFLREREDFVDSSGMVKHRAKYQSVLDRYSVLLFHAYEHNIDRGSSFWQNLKKAKMLRDYYTHLDVNEPRAITTDNVVEFMEQTLLGLIWPSSIMKRTLMLGQYDLYNILTELRECSIDYRERPFFMDWYLREESMFHCNFENVDPVRFPSVRDDVNWKAFIARRREQQGEKKDEAAGSGAGDRASEPGG